MCEARSTICSTMHSYMEDESTDVAIGSAESLLSLVVHVPTRSKLTLTVPRPNPSRPFDLTEYKQKCWTYNYSHFDKSNTLVLYYMTIQHTIT